MNTIILLLATMTPTAELVWTVDRPAIDVIRELRGSFGEEESPLLKSLLPLVFTVHTKCTATAWPASHYYRFEIVLLRPVGKINGVRKSLEIWAQPERTVFRSHIEVDYGRHFRLRLIERLKNRIVAAVESGILAKERAKIMELAR